MYFTWVRSATTNGGGNTCSNHFRLLTVANQQNCVVTQIGAQVRNSTTAGSGYLSVAVYAQGTTAGGTTYTLNKMNPSFAAAATGAATDATAFTSYPTVTRLEAIGFAQTGGRGGWVALERDNGYTLNPNGGAAGNLSLESFTATASQLLEVGGQLLEG
jgi:hypothetical protein